MQVFRPGRSMWTSLAASSKARASFGLPWSAQACNMAVVTLVWLSTARTIGGDSPSSESMTLITDERLEFMNVVGMPLLL
eukprot:scaffold282930_cov30-Tisochrysis_lutea.AAC.3